MSTKIYNGCKLTNKPKNLKEVRDIIFKFKEKAMEYYRTKYYGLLARDIVFIYDDALLAKKVFYKFPHYYDDKKVETFQDLSDGRSLWGAVSNSVDRRGEIFRKQHDRTHEFWQYEFYCNVTILPCNDEVFVIPFTEEKEIQDMFSQTEGIEDYPYWNNSDQPDGMTWEEWEVVGEEWDEAIGSGVPSQNGFGMDIIDGTVSVKIYPKQDCDPTAFDETLKYIPTTEDRVKRLLSMDMRKTWKEENREAIDVLLSTDKSDYDKWKEADDRYKQFRKDNPDRYEKRRAELAKMIKIDFTEEDILINVKNFTKLFGIEPEEEKE